MQHHKQQITPVKHPLRVTIAMCSYNGARHLDEQLQSIALQTFSDWDLWVSDDGSRDDTRAILERFKAQVSDQHRVTIIDGPGKGAAANFLTLVSHPDFPTDTLVAFSDQDDVWAPHKLSLAVDRLADRGDIAVYGAQTLYGDAQLRPIGASMLPRISPDLRTTLVQNSVSGHSMVFTPAALGVVRQGPKGLPHHDWWVSLLVAATGGAIVIDDAVVLTYRQHGGNVMGAHSGAVPALRRICQLFDGTFGDWFARNLRGLEVVHDLLDDAAHALLHDLRAAPRRIGLARFRVLRRHGVRRQSAVQSWAFYLAVILGRV